MSKVNDGDNMAVVSIDSIVAEWKIDAKIDDSQVQRELIKTPNLHAKYLEYFIFMKAKLAAAEKKHNTMMWVRRRYFKGELTQEELTKYGWDQYQGLKMSQAEFNSVSEYDPVLLESREQVNMYKISVTSLEYIMKQIQGRDWSLKSIIDYQRWLSGG